MKPTFLSLTLGIAGLALTIISPAADDPAKPEPTSQAGIQFFESKVRPVLADHCFKCHGDSKHKGNLRLDSRTGMLTGGDQGPAITPGQPDKSLLIKAVNYVD